jgi:hypothetical protein
MAGKQNTSAISSRLSIFNNTIYFAEDIGKVWAIDTTDSLTTVWGYQDTGSSGHTCTSNSNCTVKALYLDTGSRRVYYGDQDGHVYVVSRNGVTSGGTLYQSAYPMRPTGAATMAPFDAFTTAPVYISGLSVGGANAGVIAIGSSTGKVFFIDQWNGSAAASIRMYSYGSAVSAISYRYATVSSGTFMISTANGRTYYISSADVTDTSFTIN